MKKVRVLTILAVTLLAACGGGGGGESASENQINDSSASDLAAPDNQNPPLDDPVNTVVTPPEPVANFLQQSVNYYCSVNNSSDGWIWNFSSDNQLSFVVSGNVLQHPNVDALAVSSAHSLIYKSDDLR